MIVVLKGRDLRLRNEDEKAKGPERRKTVRQKENRESDDLKSSEDSTSRRRE